jgi:phosphate-selective porin OprO and OprP
VLIRLLLAVWLCVIAAPGQAADVQKDQPTAEATKPAKAKKTKPKDQSQPKDPAKPKKQKKPKSNVPAPDEPFNPDEPIEPNAVETGGGGWRFSWKQHPSVRYGTVFRLDGQAKFQEDAHSTYEGAVDVPEWELHRNRIGISGYLFKKVEYEVERELTEKELTDKDILAGVTPASHWKDVNVNLTFVKNAQVQIGKFKVPFGLDQLTGVTHNDFIYRSLGANYLAPARDIGAMVHGRFFKRGLNYWAGVFQHDGDNARSKKIQGGDETFAARVTGMPFRKIASGSIAAIEIGSSFAISKLSDDSFRPNGLRGRTVVSQDTFAEPVYVKGHRRRWEADADWASGPFAARTEYTWVSDDRNGQGLGDENLPDARARSWYVSGVWVVTAENKMRPLKPATEFLQGGWGAVEVVARMERLWYDSVGPSNGIAFRNPRAETILPTGDRVVTVGANWILNRFTKLQINAIREHLEDADRNPLTNGGALWSRIVRLQFVL